MGVSFVRLHFVKRREHFSTDGARCGVGFMNIFNVAPQLGGDVFETVWALATTSFDSWEIFKMNYNSGFLYIFLCVYDL